MCKDKGRLSEEEEHGEGLSRGLGGVRGKMQMLNKAFGQKMIVIKFKKNL